MEGVEDIPEIVMTEGLTWDWESFPEFLDAISARPHDIDVGAYIPHSALRVYVMGERGANREPATADDMKKMAQLVREASDAGALGFATSNIFAHRRVDGEPIPSFEVAEEELHAIAAGLAESGRGVFQIVPEQARAEGDTSPDVIKLLQRISDRSGVTVTFTTAQVQDSPDRWRAVLDMVDAGKASGGKRLRPQFFPRPVGMLIGHNLSNNPFLLCPTYQPLIKLTLAQRIVELRKPQVRERLLNEVPQIPLLPLMALGRQFERTFPVSDPPDYEPPMRTSVAAEAERRGISAAALAYDMLLEDDGRAMLYVAFANYADGNLDFVLDLFNHPDTIIALGDGGAHYGLICDASYPSFVLTHFTRDRAGKRMSLPSAIKALSSTPAKMVGLEDRGLLVAGYKANINVIDYKNLRLNRPTVEFDLPGGGRRLMQTAKGFRWTIVNGVVISRDDQPTGMLPGKLVRGSQRAKPLVSLQ
jgi:N-acyl-D-amino-acid deacylase